MIHGFWVPDLYGKIDANPGRINRISFQANQPGEFRGVCAELCGSGHSGMMFRVTALSQDDFNTWIQQQQSGGPPSAGGAGSPDQGKAIIRQEPCGTCHIIPGIAGANGTIGPNLSGVAEPDDDRGRCRTEQWSGRPQEVDPRIRPASNQAPPCPTRT